MQKLPYKDFSFTNVTVDEGGTTLQRILSTPDDSDYDYWLIFDLEYTIECIGRTSNFQLLPHKREVENN